MLATHIHVGRDDRASLATDDFTDQPTRLGRLRAVPRRPAQAAADDGDVVRRQQRHGDGLGWNPPLPARPVLRSCHGAGCSGHPLEASSGDGPSLDLAALMNRRTTRPISTKSSSIWMLTTIRAVLVVGVMSPNPTVAKTVMAK